MGGWLSIEWLQVGTPSRELLAGVPTVQTDSSYWSLPSSYQYDDWNMLRKASRRGGPIRGSPQLSPETWPCAVLSTPPHCMTAGLMPKVIELVVDPCGDVPPCR